MEKVSVQRSPVTNASGEVYLVGLEDHFFGTPGKWDMRRDPETGHCWLDPRPADPEVAGLYENYYTHDGPSTKPPSHTIPIEIARNHRLGYPLNRPGSVFAKILSKVPMIASRASLEVMGIAHQQTGRILDFGCGSGDFLGAMQKWGWLTYGVEPDAAATAQALRLGILVVPTLDDPRIVAEGKFDVITMNHVLEHVSDPVELLTRLGSLLASGGTLVLTTPNVRSLGARIFRRKWRGLEVPRHFNLFSVESLTQAMAAAGFTMVSMSTESRLALPMSFASLKAHGFLAPFACKVVAYAFAIIEDLLSLAFPGIGEELFCVARIEGANS